MTNGELVINQDVIKGAFFQPYAPLGTLKFGVQDVYAMYFGSMLIAGGALVLDFEAVYRTTLPNELINPMFIFPDAQIAVDWGDGSAIEVVNANVFGQHTYAVAGDYTVKGTFTTLPTSLNNSFLSVARMIQLVSLDTSMVTNFGGAWNFCTGLTSFPLIDTSRGTLFTNAWRNMTALTSFPALDLSGGTVFANCWNGCSMLVCFAALDFSSLTNGPSAFTACPLLVQPPATGTPVRAANAATQGVWVNPNPCP